MHFPNLNFTSLLSLPFILSSQSNTTSGQVQSTAVNMAYADTLLASLVKAKLSPGPLVPEGFKPVAELKISFAGKDVTGGNYLKTGETKEAPSFSFSVDAPEGSSYTLLLVDPDAPIPEDPKFAFWRHWVLPGLTGSSEKTKPALTEYLGPGAKDETATPHRYIILLYKEPASFVSLTKADVGGEEFVERRSFKADEFVKKHGLELVAANWFLGVGDSFKGE